MLQLVALDGEDFKPDSQRQAEAYRTMILQLKNPLSDSGEGTGERRGRPAPPLFPSCHRLEEGTFQP